MSTLSLLLTLAPAASMQDPGLLAALPSDAIALVYCADPIALRDRLRANDWVRLMSSDDGEDLYVDLESFLEPWTGSGLRQPIDVGIELEGESALFVTPEASGFLTARPAAPERLIAAMRAWLDDHGRSRHDEPSAAAMTPERRGAEVSGARVEMAIAPHEMWPVRTAAFVDHPAVLALMTADSEEALLRALRGTLAALAKSEPSPLVEKFRAARAEHGALAIEAFVDFSPLVAQAEAELASAASDLGIDPTGLLGLENGTHLYLTADVHPGDRVECRGALAIPPETLAASLADTFVPLPSGLAASLPKSAWGTVALGWNYMQMIDRVRAALEADGQKDALARLDGGIESASAMAGADVEEELLRQLTGTFTFFFGPVRPEPGYGPPSAMGFHASIADASTFVDAFEALLGITPAEDASEIVQIEDQDVYVIEEDIGFAVLPTHFLVTYGRPMLEETVRALLGQVRESVATGTRLEAALGENQGASFLVCLELTPFREMSMRAQPPAPGTEGASADGAPSDGAPATGAAPTDATKPQPPNPFDCQLVAAARRTKNGFALRLYTR